MIGIRPSRSEPPPAADPAANPPAPPTGPGTSAPARPWRPPSAVPRRIRDLIFGLLVVALAVAGIWVGIRAAYGGFSHAYTLTVNMPRAGQNLLTGSDVRERGVVIGSVSSIELAGDHARLTLRIDPEFHVPAGATATVDLKTLLGAKYVDLRFARYAPPFLQPGGAIQTARVGPELEDVLADGVQVLDAIRPPDLATVVSTLSQAASGHGADVARGLDANAALSALFAQTLDPQMRALHDFVVVFGTLKSSGADLNALADAVNQGVPVYASAAAHAQLRKALEALVPFSNNVADLLVLNRSQWDRLIHQGDVVLGTLQANAPGLQNLVHGLYRYVARLAPKPVGFGDGSASAGFVAFIGGDGFKNVVRQLCGALPGDVRAQIPVCGGHV
jgi:phospholipid/cholesterol/gamma-HCH transport system substrate-binding protein